MDYLNDAHIMLQYFVIFVLPLIVVGAIAAARVALRNRRWRRQEEKVAQLRAELLEGEFDRMAGH